MRRRCLAFLSIIRTEFVFHIQSFLRALDWVHLLGLCFCIFCHFCRRFHTTISCIFICYSGAPFDLHFEAFCPVLSCLVYHWFLLWLYHHTCHHTCHSFTIHHHPDTLVESIHHTLSLLSFFLPSPFSIIHSLTSQPISSPLYGVPTQP